MSFSLPRPLVSIESLVVSQRGVMLVAVGDSRKLIMGLCNAESKAARPLAWGSDDPTPTPTPPVAAHVEIGGDRVVGVADSTNAMLSALPSAFSTATVETMKLQTLLDVFRARLHRRRQRRVPLPTVPDVAGRRFLFLGGLHRSGTTLLHRLLGAHPDTSGFTDTGVPRDEGQHLQNVFPAANQFGGAGRFAFAPEARLIETSPLVSVANRDRLLREWGAYYDLTKPVLLEKSPPNLIRARFFQALLPNTRFVFIVRHPLAVAAATVKWSQTTLAELVLHWCLAHRLMLSDLDRLDHALVLRYEDFVEAPQFWLDAAFRLAELSPIRVSERVENRNAPYFAIWEQQQAAHNDAAAALADLALPTMAVFGYRLDAPLVKAWSGLTRAAALENDAGDRHTPARQSQ